MAGFFIDRPIFAWVIAILIMVAGGLATVNLPVKQYPAIAPPQVSITARYPGASAQVLEESVTQVIEQQMKGLDGLRYINSTSESTGMATVSLTFNNGIDPDTAQVQVQNKLQLAVPALPMAVQQQGLQVAKSVRNFLMVAALVSRDGSLSMGDLGDYLSSHVEDAIARVPGVGEVTVFTSQYAMRIWLDPHKLHQYGLTPADVAAAVKAQNAQVSAGQLGAQPSLPGQEINVTVKVQSRLRSAEEFGRILLKSDSGGAQVRLHDVARIELGNERYDSMPRYNGQPAAAMAIRLASGANALDTAEAVRTRMDELAELFPAGVEAVYPYDTTPFVRIAIGEVVKTLIEAIILVVLVMYLFMQNLRATIIPTIAVPVVLLGTFGILTLFGYSINTLTMFAMVLAIGLLVDDAIVVVENVERVMREEKLDAIEATRRSMQQITPALIGIALVLSAVFVPMAFFGGSTGVIYRQFAVTIVSAMLLSVVVALTLSPALCAHFLHHGDEVLHQRGPFGWFNRLFDWGQGRYQNGVAAILQQRSRFFLLYLAAVAVVTILMVMMPTAFLPEEDQGIIISSINLPAGATEERTLEVVKQVEQHFLNDPAVEQMVSVVGFSFSGRGQNMAIAFTRLKPWHERRSPELSVKATAGRAMGAFMQIRDARAFAFAPPAVIELGNASGFNFYLQDGAGLGHEALMAARNQFLGMAAQEPRLMAVRPNGLDDGPQLRVELDHARAGAYGLSIAEINNTLAAAWGSAYLDDFIHQGRVKKVFMQADAPYRMQPEDLNDWYVRNNQGEMVPFAAFASTRWDYGSPRLERYNGLPAVNLMGMPAPGVSSGEAMAAVEEIIARLPKGVSHSWTGLSYEERAAGAQAPLLYALSILVVFLALAALYESWSIPFSVLMVVPLGILGALTAAHLRMLPNDIYFQVGLLTTIGLSAKNAILIVEFAGAQLAEGKALLQATLEAARMRLRPILMTSLAFGFGVLPLAISSGAGSGSQNAIGTGVLGGVIAATVLGVLFVPLFYVLIKTVFTPRND